MVAVGGVFPLDGRRLIQCARRYGGTALAVSLALLGPAVADAQLKDATTSLGQETFVYVVSHGWHVALVLRRQDLCPVSRPDRYSPGPFRYLEVGWGDGDYYPAKRGTIPLALRAAFRSRWSVLQVVGFDDPVTEMFPRSKILQIELSPDSLGSLARYIEASFAVDRDGRPIIVGPAQYGIGFFYHARGHYRLLDNSNSWVARGLKIAGCPIDVEAAVTAGAVLHQAARFAHVLRPGTFLRGSDDVGMRCGFDGTRQGG